MWGGRFLASPAAIMEEINASIDFDKRLWRHDILASKAHAAMLAANGIIGKKDGRSEDETILLLKAYMDDQSKAIEQDFAIWEHKMHRTQPVLCDGDGPIAEFRRWTRQFYSTPLPGASA